MGGVNSATLTTSEGQHKVAIKVLHWHLMDDPAFTARFQREQALLSQLDHPNIVKLHLTGHTAEGLPFLVMDWIAGRSLTEFTQPGSTTDRQLLLHIADDLCAATQHAHEQGILHRDLKPQNIIVTPEGRAIVLDFGIARSLRPGHTLTQPSDAPGTHGYIAPEVLAGEKPDARADIYSLGIIIYQLLMKKLPDVFAARPSEHSLDPRFDEIVMKAAAAEREKRYQTVEDLKRALQSIHVMNEATVTKSKERLLQVRQQCIELLSRRPFFLTRCVITAATCLAVVPVFAYLIAFSLIDFIGGEQLLNDQPVVAVAVFILLGLVGIWSIPVAGRWCWKRLHSAVKNYYIDMSDDELLECLNRRGADQVVVQPRSTAMRHPASLPTVDTPEPTKVEHSRPRANSAAPGFKSTTPAELPWRMIQSPCGHVVARFAHRCPACHHPNTWVKKQKLFGVLMMFGGIVGLLAGSNDVSTLSQFAFWVGLAWCVFLSMAESWYGKGLE